jgi:UDP:flavonoid glycosyltransferase YjiC (YdhE family)
MGSIGSADLSLMKRLIEILGKSPHRFIISKGPLGDEYSLADNMWGEKMVSQVKVLPLVDLVITHGGNNTITENFSFGKPSIILPLFADQFDNAERIQVKGFGIRLDTYYCSEEELLDAIEKLLADKELAKKLKIISKNMREIDNRAKVIELIEALV